MAYFDNNVCVNRSTSQKYCENEVCGSDGFDCLSDKRHPSNITGVIVVDFVIKSTTNNETLINESIPILFGKYMPYYLSVDQGLPGFFIRRLTVDSFSAGTGSQMFSQLGW